MVDIQIGLDADIEKVEKLTQHYLDLLPAKYPELINEPQFIGVVNMAGAEVTIRITLETLPLQHYAISRVIRRDVIDILAKNGIPLAYPKMMLYDRGNKGGEE